MSQPSIADNDSSRRSRIRRRETMLNATATILGCLALVVMIATVVRVVMVKLWESAKVNPEYVQTFYEGAHERQIKASHPTSAGPSLTDLPARHAPSTAPKSVIAAARPQDQGSGEPSHAEIPLTLSRHEVTISGIQEIDTKRPRIEGTLRGFCEAGSIEAKLAFVRDAERVRPLMQKYDRENPTTQRGWKGLGWVLPVEEPGFRLGYAQATFTDAEPVSLIIEEQQDGTFRVDWESSVRYGELEWGEFINTQPTSPKLFRVIASRPRHAPSSESSQGNEVLEIKHPDNDHVIYAYFDRLDPKFESLVQQLQSRNWKDVPLTLRLCYTGPADGGKNSVRIADIEGKGWLILQGTRS